MLDRLKQNGFVVSYESHAEAILERDFLAAAEDIESAIANFEGFL